MEKTTLERQLPLLAAALMLTISAFAPAWAQGPDPWNVLQGVRKSLVAAGPTGAEFTQVYVPAGFSSGETETGRLSLALPDCLRWDYQNPYPKSFLLCGEVAHTWNAEDKSGRRYRVDRENEPGLDLLLLGVDALKSRYKATAKEDGGRVAVSLTPKGKVEELADARLLVDPQSQRIVEVTYHDREGNLTRFTIKGYRGLPRQGQFTPPAGIRWES